MLTGVVLPIVLASLGGWFVVTRRAFIIGGGHLGGGTLEIEGWPAILLGVSFIALAARRCPGIHRLGRNVHAIAAWLGVLALIVGVPLFSGVMLWLLFDLTTF